MYDFLHKSLKYDIYFKHDDIFYAADKKFRKDVGDHYNLEQKYQLIKEIDYEKMYKFIKRIVLIREIVIIGDKDV